MRKILLIWVVLLTAILNGSLCSAYDNEYVHPAINGNAAEQSQLNNLLTNHLGIDDGIDAIIDGKKIKFWIEQGGKDEDSDIRALSHFHDPLDSWSLAGLLYAQSALVWAQNTETNSSTWQQAREYYFQALSTGNEEHFAKTFKTLGQVMHLVADMAVPAHVRLDKHFSTDLTPSWMEDPDPYEDWAANSTNLNFATLPVSSSIFSNAVSDFRAPVPITALWDQNIYDGNNPGATLSGTGLAEYTNANFFSKDTIATYPNPSPQDLTPGVDWLNPIQIGADLRVYLMGNVNGAIKLAGASLITYDTMQQGYTPIWMLDDEVHQDYASRLIPAAVGYSKALLNKIPLSLQVAA